MTIATVTTDINIGPFRIPSNGQNMIMNNYAQRNKLSVELVIPEPMMSNSLATTQWIHKQNKLTVVILSSIHQLPKDIKEIDQFKKNMKDIEFHFALEGLRGKNNSFIDKIIYEVNIFDKAKYIDSSNTNWIELYNMKE